MLVPTLPASRFLVLDNADLPAAVCVALAAERVQDSGGSPVLVPSWWDRGADAAMPLVHTAVERHASVYGTELASSELVVEPSDGASPGLVVSQLLLAAVPLAIEHGCDAVLFPIRPGGGSGDRDASIEDVAREVDRAELVSRLAALDAPTPCPVITPVVDLTDRQVLDLARDMAVSNELCWWHGAGGDAAGIEAGRPWREPRMLVASTEDPGDGSARIG